MICVIIMVHLFTGHYNTGVLGPAEDTGVTNDNDDDDDDDDQEMMMIEMMMMMIKKL